MLIFHQHCAEATAAFRAPFEKVHRRRVDTTAQVARQHIVANLRLGEWPPEYPFQKEEQQFVRTGLL